MNVLQNKDNQVSAVACTCGSVAWRRMRRSFHKGKKNDDIIDTSFEIETSNEEDSEDNGEKQNVEETKVITWLSSFGGKSDNYNQKTLKILLHEEWRLICHIKSISIYIVANLQEVDQIPVSNTLLYSPWHWPNLLQIESRYVSI